MSDAEISRRQKAEIVELEGKTEELRKKNLDMEVAVSPRILEQGLTAKALKPFSDMSFVVISPSDF
ncbi:MAG: hypothetical protein ACR2KT_05100 [Methylocella sp.]